MATETLSVQTSQPDCFKCHVSLKDSLQNLPCGHTLCGQCLESSLQPSGERSSKHTQCDNTPSPSTQTATQTERSFSQTTIVPGIQATTPARISPSNQTLGQTCLHSTVTMASGGFSFHDNHGRNIVLSNRGLTVHRKDCGVLDSGGSIVVSRDPMQMNTLYEVQVDAKPGCKWPIAIGVVRKIPDFLTVQFGSFWSESGVFLYRGYVVDPENTTETYRGKDMSSLPFNSRVGVSVDRSRQLHIYLNGEDQGVVSRNTLPDPCFPMLDLFGKATTVTCLPVTNLR